MDKIKFVTSNLHKFEEVRDKVSRLEINVIHQNMQYSEIQADRIEDVARASLANLVPVIPGSFFLEDAGLEIDALGGFPGPYSSFVYQTIGWKGVLNLMEGRTLRNARFISVIALYLDERVKLFKGICEGKISDQAKGDMGFGFDPIFIPEGSDLTFSEMEMGTKNQYSHRSMALDELISYLRNFID